MTTDNDIFLQIHDLLLQFQRQARSIRRAHSPIRLRNSEIHILIQIDGQPDTTAKELSRMLNLEKSTLSRIIKGLKNKELMRPETSKTDKRSKKLILTKKGKDLISELDESLSYTIVKCLTPLSNKEESELLYYVRTLADGFDASAHKVRSSDHPLSVELRRYTRGAGMLSRRFLGSDLNLTQAHMLYVIADSSGKITAKDILEEVPLYPSRVSRTLNQLEESKLLKREISPNDRRSYALSLSKNGRKAFEKHQSHARDQIREALIPLKPKETKHFKELLIKIVSANYEDEITFQDHVKVKTLKNSNDRKLARGFLIENLFRSNQHYETSEHLFVSSSFSSALYINEKLKGVCEVQQFGNEWVLENVTFAVDLTAQQTKFNFLRSALNAAFKHGDMASIIIPDKFTTLNSLKKIGAAEQSGARFEVSAQMVGANPSKSSASRRQPARAITSGKS